MANTCMHAVIKFHLIESEQNQEQTSIDEMIRKM